MFNYPCICVGRVKKLIRLGNSNFCVIKFVGYLRISKKKLTPTQSLDIRTSKQQSCQRRPGIFPTMFAWYVSWKSYDGNLQFSSKMLGTYNYMSLLNWYVFLIYSYWTFHWWCWFSYIGALLKYYHIRRFRTRLVTPPKVMSYLFDNKPQIITTCMNFD